MSLNNVERVIRNIFAGNKPRFTVSFFRAAYADAFSLADGVVGKTDVFPDDLPVSGFHRTGFVGKIAVQEFAERSLSDKADTRAVFFTCVGQADFFSDSADFRLAKLSYRENAFGELILIQTIKEVALILGRIKPL